MSGFHIVSSVKDLDSFIMCVSVQKVIMCIIILRYMQRKTCDDLIRINEKC